MVAFPWNFTIDSSATTSSSIVGGFLIARAKREWFWTSAAMLWARATNEQKYMRRIITRTLFNILARTDTFIVLARMSCVLGITRLYIRIMQNKHSFHGSKNVCKTCSFKCWPAFKIESSFAIVTLECHKHQIWYLVFVIFRSFWEKMWYIFIIV